MERSGEIESVVRRLYNLMKAGDGANVADMILDEAGVLFVGTDADEWWNTPAACKQAFREQLEATGGFDMFDFDPKGYASGDTGWFDDQPSMQLPDGTVLPMRMTGVMRRAGSTWRIIQGHLSVAANVNETLFRG